MKIDKNTATLMLGEFFDRFNFYGIQSVLLFYMIQNFSFSRTHALTMYGIYSSLAFISPIAGGYFADKLQNRHKFIFLGIIALILGNILLALDGEKVFFAGLSLIIAGIGFFKSNNAVLFGSLFKETPERRDASFTLYYAAMNAGSIVGPFVYGTLAITLGWKFGFIASIAGFSVSLFLYALRRPALLLFEGATKKNIICIKAIALYLLVSMVIYLCFVYSHAFSFLMWGAAIATIGLLFYLVCPLQNQDQKNAILLIILMFFGLIFYALGLQISSSLLLYIQDCVDTVVLGFKIPPEYFMSIYPLFILMAAPFLGKIWETHSRNNKLIGRVNLSLYLAAFAFLIIALSAVALKNPINIQLILIFLGLFTLAIGELAIGPIITAATTYLAPPNRNGIFMGIWYLFIGYSAYISSLIAKLVNFPRPNISPTLIYFQNFLGVAIVTFILALFMSSIRKYLNRFLSP